MNDTNLKVINEAVRKSHGGVIAGVEFTPIGSDVEAPFLSYEGGLRLDAGYCSDTMCLLTLITGEVIKIRFYEGGYIELTN